MKTIKVYQGTYENMGQIVKRSFQDRSNAEKWLSSFTDWTINENGVRVEAFKEIKEK